MQTKNCPDPWPGNNPPLSNHPPQEEAAWQDRPAPPSRSISSTPRTRKPPQRPWPKPTTRLFAAAQLLGFRGRDAPLDSGILTGFAFDWLPLTFSGFRRFANISGSDSIHPNSWIRSHEPHRPRLIIAIRLVDPHRMGRLGVPPCKCRQGLLWSILWTVKFFFAKYSCKGLASSTLLSGGEFSRALKERGH